MQEIDEWLQSPNGVTYFIGYESVCTLKKRNALTEHKPAGDFLRGLACNTRALVSFRHSNDIIARRSGFSHLWQVAFISFVDAVSASEVQLANHLML